MRSGACCQLAGFWGQRNFLNQGPQTIYFPATANSFHIMQLAALSSAALPSCRNSVWKSQ